MSLIWGQDLRRDEIDPVVDSTGDNKRKRSSIDESLSSAFSSGRKFDN